MESPPVDVFRIYAQQQPETKLFRYQVQWKRSKTTQWLTSYSSFLYSTAELATDAGTVYMHNLKQVSENDCKVNYH